MSDAHHQVPRLPRIQLLVIVFAVFADAVSMTFPFPFLIFMAAQQLNLHNGDPQLNTYAGLAAAAYPIGQLFAGIVYGHLSDRFQTRKRFVQLGLLFNMALFPLFGYFANEPGLFWPVCAIRLAQGLFNGNIGLLRAANGELCTRAAVRALARMHNEELDDASRYTTARFDSHVNFAAVKQSLLRTGFAVMSVGYSLGLAAGSLIGGLLQNLGPADSVLATRIYLLPCLCATALSLVAFVLVSVVLRETYVVRRRPAHSLSSERSPLLLNDDGPDSLDSRAAAAAAAKPSLWRALRSLGGRVYIVCVINGLLGLTYNGFSELFPLWAKASDAHWGLDFKALQIGVAHALTGPCATLYQLFAFRRVVQLLGGVRNMLRANQLLLVVVVGLFPLQHYATSNVYILWPVLIASQAIKAMGFGGSFASLYILVNEASSSAGGQTNAGIVNGLGQALENVGRAVAPIGMGALYAWTVTLPLPTDPFLPFAILSALFLITAGLTQFVRSPDGAAAAAAAAAVAGESVTAARGAGSVPSSGVLVRPRGGDVMALVINAGDSDGVGADSAFVTTLLADVDDAAITYNDNDDVRRFATFAPGVRVVGTEPTLLCGSCRGVHDDDCPFRTLKVVPPFRPRRGSAGGGGDDDDDDDGDDDEDEAYSYSSIVDVEVNVEALQPRTRARAAVASAVALEAGVALADDIEVALVHAADVRAHDAEMFVSTPLPLISLRRRAQLSPSLSAESEAVVSKFLRLFETIRFAPPNDQFEAVGKARFVRRLLTFVLANKRIEMILPAFPCKSPNNVKKVLGTLPDLGEELALKRLDRFCALVGKFYAPGCELLIMSDGRVFADCVGVPDEVVSEYRDCLHSLVKLEHIKFDALDNHIQGASHDAVREEMMRRYCTMTPEEMDANIRSQGGNFMVYRGFIKFCEQDRVWDREKYPSRSAVKKECGRIARRMMLRNVAFSNLVKDKHGHKLRLSIHAHDNTTKYAVALVEGLKTLRTPWHNCAVQMLDGTHELMSRADCEDRADLQLVEKGGRPYYFKQLNRSEG
jgi:pyoverdine/dityrosine biosynthesis protein Dit1/MFS family permease